MINYTEDFKRKVRSVYGNSLDDYLNSNNPFLGRILDDSSYSSISIDKILTATSLESLQKEARELKIKRELYNEYWDQPGIKKNYV